jgi:hypothetical protein
MTNELMMIVATVVAGLSAAGLIAWLMRPRPQPAIASKRKTQFEDMFAYTMYDDPC